MYFGAPDCHHDGAHDVGHDVSQDCLHAYDQNTTFIQSVARGLIEHNAQPRNGVIAITANVVFRHITSRQESPE